jgi:SOS response associated peptidase (SRAP)
MYWHDRMPVILAERDWPKRLGEVPASEDELRALLKPCADEVLKIWPVGKAVGNVKNTGPQLAISVRARTTAISAAGAGDGIRDEEHLANVMGFNRRKMEEERRLEAEKQAAPKGPVTVTSHS